jgi:nitrate/TMAO reductase-like tetraheme cytochrome c subunit
VIDWIGDRLRRLPTWGIALVSISAVAVVVGGAVAGYRTYDYIEHDNGFCLSCHLMAEPFELFARSAHRDLGCKACHKPNFQARSQMALTQIVENPDTIGAHAEVPNEKCAACHIEGDPDKWESVASSAGHRIHLESDNPVLEGLKCVECHSSSLHQFTAAAETCGQSGCHTDSSIQLGGMGQLTIHCTACHGYNDPLPEEAPLTAAFTSVQPDADACLSCHAMRALVNMPPNEPHDAVCGACHNPHDQATPAEAVETCATAACHANPVELSPMHRGLDVGALAECIECHQAHSWRVPAEDCLSCHGDVLVDEGPGRVGSPVDSDPAAPTSGPAPGPALYDPGPSPAATGAAAPALPQVADTAFSHARHRNVECTECHSTEESHGRLKVTSLSDCRSCHHEPPVSDDCSACHDSGPEGVVEVSRSMSLSVGEVASRAFDFQHEAHSRLRCGMCHTAGPELSAESVDCSTCHPIHHRPSIDCTSCHQRAPDEAHPLEVHAGCTGTGCHEEVASALNQVPGNRDFCQACHQDRRDHNPEGNCVDCHRLPSVGGDP